MFFFLTQKSTSGQTRSCPDFQNFQKRQLETKRSFGNQVCCFRSFCAAKPTERKIQLFEPKTTKQMEVCYYRSYSASTKEKTSTTRTEVKQTFDSFERRYAYLGLTSL